MNVMPRRRTSGAKRPAKTRARRDDHVIPPPVSDEALNHFKLDPQNQHQAKRVSEYVEWQCAKDKETVTYLEKIKTESVFGGDFDCWHVRTDKDTYWVITHPMNLYSQARFPSLDYTLSFHIGLMARLQAKRKGTSDERVGDVLAAAFRRWEQAAEALDASTESEEVQAVGMRCRECLIAFVKLAAEPKMVPVGAEPPKASDFIHWSELIADAIAAGARMNDIRSYLKSIARTTWQLTAWLTHAANAVRYDGLLAVDATYAVLNAYGAALLRYQRPAPDRCPRCKSVRVHIIYDDEAPVGPAVACESCGTIVKIGSTGVVTSGSARRVSVQDFAEARVAGRNRPTSDGDKDPGRG